MIRLVLGDALRVRLEGEARSAFPRECCGLIVGTSKDAVFRIDSLHPTRNLATEEGHFEIDPAEQFRLLRSVRGDERQVIGCYHSHPNGRTEPSKRDLEGAEEDGFLWLIAALREQVGPVSVAAFVYSGGTFTPLRLGSFPTTGSAADKTELR